MTIRKPIAGISLATLFLISGCGGGTLNTPAAPSGATYAHAAELRDAAIAAGYQCSRWEQLNHVEGADESGTCDDSDVFSTYTDEAAVTAHVDGLKAISNVHLLAGPNWVINSPRAHELQQKMGGQVVTGGTPLAGTSPSVAGQAFSTSLNLTVSDISLEPRITEKKCFGSAGCNVQIEMDGKVTQMPNQPIRITYQITGIEDDYISTMTMQPDGSSSYTPANVTTKTSNTETIRISVTDISAVN